MKTLSILYFILIMTTTLISQEETNPLLQDWKTPFGTPPFDKITTDDYLPAMKKAIGMHDIEIENIIVNREEPNFVNTIEALDYSGEQLKKVSRVFGGMNESMTNDKMQFLSKEIFPLLSKHKDDINLNEGLFKKVKTVYDNKGKLNLTTEQTKLLDKYYLNFIRGGVNLSADKKAEFRKINDELTTLYVKFGENVLKETNSFLMVIDDKKDLSGLPENVISTASETAKEKGHEGKWAFTIQKPSMLPFLQYSSVKPLREKLYKGYFMRGDNNNEFDNKKLIVQITVLRLKRANLLGYKTHADYILEEQMAKTPANVYELLNKLWTPALERAQVEVAEMQKIADAEGDKKIEPWDWWYYAEKLKMQKYNLDEDELRPYFQVSNVIDGVFGLASRLFGIKFIERNDITKYHPDVKVFEVQESDGKHIGILYTDYFPRDSKRGGAWMDEFRRQYKKDGKMITPIIYNVGNFSKPAGDKPALLSMDEVQTLFHEFGHALHGLLSNCTYETVSSTETPRDFVEFPSQVMENWAMHPDILKTYAKHYATGEVMPQALVDKINNSSLFNQGFTTVEYLAAALLDMDYHTITDPSEFDVNAFEKKSMDKIGLIPEILPRYRSTYFNHIFSSEAYSSGYYSYIWSAVLDADAFEAFVQSGDVLNKELAGKYRKYILSSGGTDDSMELYRRFRGQDPAIEPLLKRRGLN